MKLAFSTVCCPEWDWQRCSDYALHYGFDGVELRVTKEDSVHMPGFDGSSRIPDSSPLGKELSPSPVMLATGVCLAEMRDLREGMLLIRTAAGLGIPMLRVMITAAPNPTRTDLTAAAMAYRKLFLHGEGLGVRVLVETSGALADSAEMNRFLLLADCGGAVLWDVHNTFRYCGEPPSVTFQRLKGKIEYVHLKDSVLEGKRVEHRMVGKGDIPIEAAVRLLMEGNFEGFFSCEWVRRWNPLLSPPWIVLPEFVKVMGEMDVQKDGVPVTGDCRVREL